jgi:hypothetical protein
MSDPLHDKARAQQLGREIRERFAEMEEIILRNCFRDVVVHGEWQPDGTLRHPAELKPPITREYVQAPNLPNPLHPGDTSPRVKLTEDQEKIRSKIDPKRPFNLFEAYAWAHGPWQQTQDVELLKAVKEDMKTLKSAGIIKPIDAAGLDDYGFPKKWRKT